MDRRSFMTGSALAGASACMAAPAVAQSRRPLRWRCASSFSASLTTLYSAAETFAAAVTEATGGRFEITVSEAGDNVSHAGTLAALKGGQFEMLHTAPHYFAEVDPAFAFGSGMPFGLNQRLTNAWLYEGGGLDLVNSFLAGHGLFGLPAGNTGAQMGGWFNKEINSLDDLRGTRFRIGGFGSRIMSEIGVTPVALAPAAIVPALEANEIDAAEFAGPADDVALGLQRVARYLYYPGWWEGGIALMNLIDRPAWESLSEEDRAVLRHASSVANTLTMARYDTLNPPVLAELENAGTIIRPYTHDIMDACFTASEQIYRDVAGGNAAFAELLGSYMSYRRAGYTWFRHSEYAYDTFLMILQRGGRL